MKRKPGQMVGMILGLIALLGAVKESFDPKEPISLDLKDARVVEVITTLGAMADLPVEIGPGIEGTMTLQLDGVPFQRVLEMISHQESISLRIQDGRLIATKADQPVPAAPLAREEFRDAPRMPIEDFSRAKKDAPPLIVRTGGADSPCHVADFGEHGSLLQLLVPSTPEKAVILADLGYDPIARTRYIAVDMVGRASRRLAAIELGGNSYFGLGDSAGLHLSMPADRDTSQCLRDMAAPELIKGRPVTVQIFGQAIRPGEEPTVVVAARLGALPGTTVSAFSGPDPATGELRGFVVSGYVSRDGTAIALVCKARTVWTDPADGRQYYYTQTGQTWSKFLPLKKEETLATTIPPGAATPDPIEVRVSRVD
jgi:hypothetical protein